MKLNKSSIDSLTGAHDETRNQFFYWDDQIKGFGLRITPTGKKTFVLQYRFQGSTRRMTLGAYPILNPDHARELAMKNLGETIDGMDPSQVKKDGSQKLADISSLFGSYYEGHVLKNRTEKGQKVIKADFERLILPAIGRLPAKTISRNDIKPLLASVEDRPRTHNVVRSYLKTMFTYGIEHELIDSSPMGSFKKMPEKSRDAVLYPNELKHLFEQVAKDSNHYVRAYFPLLALTACRRSELQLAKWEYMDFENKIFTIPKTKNGTSHKVHLTDAAITILKGIIRQDGNPFVFCGTNGHAYQDIWTPWERIRKQAGLEKYTIHDIRRTMASYLAQDGVGRDRIGQILNHKDPSVTGIYARLQHADKVKTFERLAEILKEKGVLNGL